MGRTARDKRDLPHPPPVERIGLNGEHTTRRLVLVIVLLILGAGMLAYSFVNMLSPQSEWVVIEAYSSAGATCASDFTFRYRPGGGGESAAAENKAVTAQYSQLCRRAYEIFHANAEFEDCVNLYTLNHSPNQVLEVDGGLYRAFEVLEQAGSRAIYLGHVYQRYNDLFFCQDDVELTDFDPRLSEDVAREYREIAAYANDPAQIDLELLGENKVRLKISAEYLAYAQREGVEVFLDFSWMQNAFIADFLADELIAAGHTYGVLSSADGFIRNLDGSGTDYSLRLYHREGETIYQAAVMGYRGPMSVVMLRDYPLGDWERQRYYTLENGEVRTPYLDTADGLCRSALPELTCYSAGKGCAEVLTEVMDTYIADSFSPESLRPADGIHAVYFQNRVIYATDPDVALSQIYDHDGVGFSLAPAGTGT